MSNVKLQASASGTGTVTIAPPVTNSDLTINLPANSGTVPTIASVVNNGVVYTNSTGAITSSSALTFDGTNLGVGTASPASTVAVTGSTSTTLGFSVSPNGWNNARHRLTVPISGDESVWSWNYTGTALDSASYGTSTIGLTSSVIKFSVGATNTAPTEQMRLTSTGLGVGTSSPAQKLDVQGSSSPTIRVRNTSAVVSNFSQLSLETANTFSGAGNAYLRAISMNAGNSSTALAFGVNADGGGAPYEAMRLDQAGNLGLGVTPSAWNSAVRAIELLSPGSAIYGLSGGTTVTAGAYIDSVGWKYSVSGVPITRYDQGAFASGQHTWFNAASGTAGNAISWTQAMTLDTSGRLGIGETSPDQMLVVKSGSAAASYIKINAPSYDTAIIGVDSSVFRIESSSTSPIAFRINGSERARITSGGDLLVGTTSATARVSIVPSGSDALALLRATVVGVRLTPSADVYMYDTNGNWTNTVRAGSFANMSDVRFKNVRGSLESVLGKLNSVETIRYTVKSGSDKEQIGFSAQNLKEVFPEFVIGVEDDIGYGVNYAQFAAVLTKAIQELKAEFDAYKATHP